MFVYILECSDGSYYVGVTNDVERRVAEHNEGRDQKSYTHNKRPVSLKFCESFDDPLQTIEFEKRLKGWSRKKKEALFRKDWEEIRKLAKNYSSKQHPSTSSG
ncbi:MAG: GIY-YIG nuclease family protein [Proteobacteria bacterium]|nr:GIY-YIG nuclease family protein [Pseudomonadota bacterium]